MNPAEQALRRISGYSGSRSLNSGISSVPEKKEASAQSPQAEAVRRKLPGMRSLYWKQKRRSRIPEREQKQPEQRNHMLRLISEKGILNPFLKTEEKLRLLRRSLMRKFLLHSLKARRSLLHSLKARRSLLHSLKERKFLLYSLKVRRFPPNRRETGKNRRLAPHG